MITQSLSTKKERVNWLVSFPLRHILLAIGQHLLSVFITAITPALMICQALGLPAQDSQRIISLALLTSGFASLWQMGIKKSSNTLLLSIQGTSFNFVSPLIVGGIALKNDGIDTQTMMATLFGTLMLASCTEIILARFLSLVRRIITPLISGVIVVIIGLSLIQVSLTAIGGGYAAISNDSFGDPRYLLLAGVVLLSLIILNCQRFSFLRATALPIAILLGYGLAWGMNMLPENLQVNQQPVIEFPSPLHYGIGVNWNLLIPLIIVFIVTSLEVVIGITSTASPKELLSLQRLEKGLLINGISSMFSALLNTFSNVCLSRSHSVIKLTHGIHRNVGVIVSILLIALGFFPAVSHFVLYIPEPVLGGVTLLMFTSILVSGIRLISRQPLNFRTIVIIVLPLVVVSQQPFILQIVPEWLQMALFSSMIASGGITAIVLNMLLPHGK